MLKLEGDTLLRETANRNLKIAENVGFEKSRKALQDVADRLKEGADDYQPLLDRAYEIGYQPSWDGTVNFALKNSPVGVVLEGVPNESVIDVTQALSDQEAVRQGYLDSSAVSLPESVEEYDIQDIIGGASDGSDSVTPNNAWVQTAPGGGVTDGPHYRWLNNGGVFGAEMEHIRGQANH